ncbi:hypothetical protein [Streptomyces sp. UH6]|uniref:hypothetical protein n=1 Tax=Streptomyces sp. UH6 TaxID=2748379 RepID=UPI0015D4D4E5|nr:hypothetical protein [Streptomyces sp. UH6]NYV76867.1 hypothetical protein [Streptomyces sp. UH6]
MARPSVIPPATPSLAQLVRGTGAAVLCTTALLALTGASSVPAVALIAVLSLVAGVLAATAARAGGRDGGGRVPATRDTADAERRREPARR